MPGFFLSGGSYPILSSTSKIVCLLKVFQNFDQISCQVWSIGTKILSGLQFLKAFLIIQIVSMDKYVHFKHNLMCICNKQMSRNLFLLSSKVMSFLLLSKPHFHTRICFLSLSPIKSCRTCFLLTPKLPLLMFRLVLVLSLLLSMTPCCVTFSESIIIIMLCHKHRYPWPSLATSPYRSSPLAGLQDYVLYPHIAAVCMFELVILLLPGHMWGSIGVHHLWARPCFSSSVLHVWFI